MDIQLLFLEQVIIALGSTLFSPFLICSLFVNSFEKKKEKKEEGLWRHKQIQKVLLYLLPSENNMSRFNFSLLVAVVLAVSASLANASTFVLDTTSDSPACITAVDSSLYIVSLSGSFNTYRVENIFGQDIFSHAFNPAVFEPSSFYPFLGTYSMPIGKTAPTSVYISSNRIDLFIDVSSFRSTDPTNTLFFESNICFVTYSLALARRSAREENAVERSAVTPIFTNPPSLGLCEFISVSHATYSEAQSCILSVPFNSTTRDSITNSLISTLDSYVYREYLKNTGISGTPKVDIIGGLQNISTTSYSNDYDLQLALANLFLQNQDLLAQYTPLVCYQGFEFVQPFLLSSRALANGTQRITVGGVNSAFPQQYFGADFSTFIDYHILTIDGQDALQAVIDASASMPMKDAGARFQAALLSYHTNGSYIPINSSVTYELLHSVTGEQITLVVPWYSVVPNIGSSLQLQLNCFADYLQTCVLGKRSTESTRPSKIDTILNARQTTHNNNQKRQNFAPFVSAVETFGTLELYRVSDRVGVLRVPSFDNGLGVIDFTVLSSVAYLAAINRYNFQQVIIDVSSNAGGIFHNAAHLAALFQNRTTDTNQFFYADQIASNLFTQLIDVYWANLDAYAITYLYNDTDFTYYKKALDNGSIPNPGQNWYNSSVSSSRGGVSAGYSQRIMVDQLYAAATANNVLNFTLSRPEYTTYSHWDIQILTDGFCLETCGVFVRGLRQQTVNPIRTVGYGGLISKTLRSSDSVYVGSSYSGLLRLSNEMSYLLNDYTRLSSVTPPPFEVVNSCTAYNGTAISFALYELYRSTTESTPEDYLDDPVDQRLNIWLTFGESNTGVYYQAATVFETSKTTHNSYFDSSASSLQAMGLLSLIVILFFAF